MENKIIGYLQLDKNVVRLKIRVRVPGGSTSDILWLALLLQDDDDMNSIWDLPDDCKYFGVQIHVETETIIQPTVHENPEVGNHGGFSTPAYHIGEFTNILLGGCNQYPVNDAYISNMQGPSRTLDVEQL